MIRKSVVLSASFVICLSAHASSWDPKNAPEMLEQGFTHYFDETGTRIPFESHVPTFAMPYADTYWPANRGGIAYRWNESDPRFAWVDPYMIDVDLHQYDAQGNYNPSRLDVSEARASGDLQVILGQLN